MQTTTLELEACRALLERIKKVAESDDGAFYNSTEALAHAYVLIKTVGR